MTLVTADPELFADAPCGGRPHLHDLRADHEPRWCAQRGVLRSARCRQDYALGRHGVGGVGRGLHRGSPGDHTVATPTLTCTDHTPSGYPTPQGCSAATEPGQNGREHSQCRDPGRRAL
jgi:hypothetical protein